MIKKKMGDILSSSNFWIFILTCIGAWFIYHNSNKNDESTHRIESATENLVNKSKETIKQLNSVSSDIRDSQDKAKQTYDTLIETYEKTKKVSDQTIENLKEIIQTQEEVLKSKDEVIGKITGGDSYPRASISNGYINIFIKGKYSIPKVNIQVFVLKNYIDTPEKELREYISERKTDGNHVKLVHNKNYPKLWKNGRVVQIPITNEMSLDFLSSATIAIDIYFASKYKRWAQKIRLIKSTVTDNEYEVINLLFEEKNAIDNDSEERVIPLEEKVSKNYGLNLPDGKGGQYEIVTRNKEGEIDYYMLLVYSNKDRVFTGFYQPNYGLKAKEGNNNLSTIRITDLISKEEKNK